MFAQVGDTLGQILSEVFLNPDVLRAVVAVVIAVVVGMILTEFKPAAVARSVAIAVVVFAAIMALLDFPFGRFPSDPLGTIGSWLDASLTSLLNVRLGVVLAYFVAFFIVVAAAFGVRSVLK